MIKMENMMPENELELKIISSEIFREACEFSKSNGEGHPEKNVGEHIKQILDFIDSQNWKHHKTDLRLLGLLHDLGKFKTQYDENGNLIGQGHAVYSEEIAREFISDTQFLDMIRKHDKYFHFFKDDKRGKFKPDKFLKTYEHLDLDALIRFNYADSCNREKDSVKWFEDKVCELGMRSEKVYNVDLI